MHKVQRIPVSNKQNALFVAGSRIHCVSATVAAFQQPVCKSPEYLRHDSGMYLFQLRDEETKEWMIWDKLGKRLRGDWGNKNIQCSAPEQARRVKASQTLNCLPGLPCCKASVKRRPRLINETGSNRIKNENWLFRLQTCKSTRCEKHRWCSLLSHRCGNSACKAEGIDPLTPSAAPCTGVQTEDKKPQHEGNGLPLSRGPEKFKMERHMTFGNMSSSFVFMLQTGTKSSLTAPYSSVSTHFHL
ncbi:uncharacterized protein LOC132648962 [Meriones unguiculatus]|uniref:uncharacterized protein LOC132648962 n=1 Tax=Meriones unguiculatus TaxID=10047 RepID=UPI00293F463D|nr:uncharacterized protein LOC132648962 [Meriones unguiculatus]